MARFFLHKLSQRSAIRSAYVRLIRVLEIQHQYYIPLNHGLSSQNPSTVFALRHPPTRSLSSSELTDTPDRPRHHDAVKRYTRLRFLVLTSVGSLPRMIGNIIDFKTLRVRVLVWGCLSTNSGSGVTVCEAIERSMGFWESW